MAASNTTVGITEGAGLLVATRTVDSAHNQKVTIGGAEDGESFVHLPAHDAADAGAPLKIGGRAQRSVPTAVAAGDRVNAWHTLEGQQGVVATLEARALYVNDATNGGRILPTYAFGTSALNNAAAAAVAAQGASLRCYVVAVTALCVAFTGAGYVTLRNDATDVFPVAGITAVNIGGPFCVAPPGTFLCSTSANTALNLYFSGNGTIKWSVVYYVAP